MALNVICAKAAGFSWPLPEGLNGEELKGRIIPYYAATAQKMGRDKYWTLLANSLHELLMLLPTAVAKSEMSA